MIEKTIRRCGWVSDDPLYIAYHDTEWGVPSHDDRHLFEMLILEGAQAGLSWITILKKRETYRAAFDNFDAAKVARYTPARVEKLMANPGIVRNRAKINATILNAKPCCKFAKSTARSMRFCGNSPAAKRFATSSRPIAMARSRLQHQTR